MNKSPLFSVLMANYNNGQYLQAAIDSIFSQTYTNWEIILVDDGSTDNSFDIYKKYEQDSRFHIFYNSENRGVGYTKRRCTELANGVFCGVLDPDDSLLYHAIQLMVNNFFEDPTFSMIFSRKNICDENLKIKYQSRKLEIPVGSNYFINLDYQAEHFFSFRKSYYDQTTGINPKCLGCEDLDIYFKLEEVGKLKILDDITYNYRSGHSSSISDAKFYEDHLWGIIVKYETCLRRGLDPNIYVLEYLKDFGTYLKQIGYNNASKKIKSKMHYRIADFFYNPVWKIIKRIKEK